MKDIGTRLLSFPAAFSASRHLLIVSKKIMGLSTQVCTEESDDKKKMRHSLHFFHSPPPLKQSTSSDDDNDKIATQIQPRPRQKIDSGPWCCQCTRFGTCSANPHTKCTCHAEGRLCTNCIPGPRCTNKSPSTESGTPQTPLTKINSPHPRSPIPNTASPQEMPPLATVEVAQQ